MLDRLVSVCMSVLVFQHALTALTKGGDPELAIPDLAREEQAVILRGLINRCRR